MKRMRALAPTPNDGSFWLNRGAVGAGQTSYSPAENHQALSTGSFPINTLKAFPLTFPIKTNLSALIAEVTTLAAGGVYRIGVYNNVAAPGTWYPNALVFDSGELTSDTVAVDSVACALTILGGRRYHLAILPGVLAATFRSAGGAGCPAFLGNQPTGPANRRLGLTVAQAYGALPDPFPAGATYEISVACPIWASVAA